MPHRSRKGVRGLSPKVIAVLVKSSARGHHRCPRCWVSPRESWYLLRKATPLIPKLTKKWKIVCWIAVNAVSQADQYMKQSNLVKRKNNIESTRSNMQGSSQYTMLPACMPAGTPSDSCFAPDTCKGAWSTG